MAYWGVGKERQAVLPHNPKGKKFTGKRSMSGKIQVVLNRLIGGDFDGKETEKVY